MPLTLSACFSEVRKSMGFRKLKSETSVTDIRTHNARTEDFIRHVTVHDTTLTTIIKVYIMCMAHHAYDKTAWQTWRIKYNKSAFLLFLYKNLVSLKAQTCKSKYEKHALLKACKNKKTA